MGFLPGARFLTASILLSLDIKHNIEIVLYASISIYSRMIRLAPLLSQEHQSSPTGLRLARSVYFPGEL